MSDQLPPVSEQTGPPPLVEELTDTNDLPEGYDLPEQSTEPDFDFDFDDEESV